MTTPSFVMPYGVTVEASGEERSARAVTDSPHVEKGVRVVLPDGPCRVAASWDGPESVRLVHAGHGYPVVIPAGGITPGWPLSVLRRANLSTWRTAQNRHSPRVGAAQSRFILSSQSGSAPRRGGGVDGGGGFRESANDHIVRRVVDAGGDSASQRCDVSAVAGGRFDGVAVKQDVGPVRLSVHGAVCIEKVLANRNCTGRDAGYSERCGSQRRRAVSQYPRLLRHLSRCGSDHHHLPADVAAAGGGLLNDIPNSARFHAFARAETRFDADGSTRRNSRGAWSERFGYRILPPRRSTSAYSRFRRKPLDIHLQRGSKVFRGMGAAQQQNGPTGARRTRTHPSVCVDRKPRKTNINWDNCLRASRIAGAEVAA